MQCTPALNALNWGGGAVFFWIFLSVGAGVKKVRKRGPSRLPSVRVTRRPVGLKTSASYSTLAWTEQRTAAVATAYTMRSPEVMPGIRLGGSHHFAMIHNFTYILTQKFLCWCDTQMSQQGRCGDTIQPPTVVEVMKMLNDCLRGARQAQLPVGADRATAVVPQQPPAGLRHLARGLRQATGRPPQRSGMESMETISSGNKTQKRMLFLGFRFWHEEVCPHVATPQKSVGSV